MTIERPPHPNDPSKAPGTTPGVKRKQDPHEEQPAATKRKQELIEKGFFQGLPVPFEIKNPNHPSSSTPYISCNEVGQQATLAATQPSMTIPPERRVHLGFAYWFNFDLICHTKPSYAIICDIDDNLMYVFQEFGNILEKSSNRREFVDHFNSYILNNPHEMFGELPPEEITKLFDCLKELTRPGSWLASEESFQFIKKMQREGRLLFLNFDITDKEGFIKIKTWLDKNKLELDTLYASNIIEWLRANDLKAQAYLQNLKMVATPNTRFIQAWATDKKAGPLQRMVTGVDNIELPPRDVPKKQMRRV